MRPFTTVLILAAMATVALAQDPNPNGNRMNDPLLQQVQPQEWAARPYALSGLPSPYSNRMNVAYGTELGGGPNPYGNRMNFEWPKPEAPERRVETEPVYPEPTP